MVIWVTLAVKLLKENSSVCSFSGWALVCERKTKQKTKTKQKQKQKQIKNKTKKSKKKTKNKNKKNPSVLVNSVFK